MSRKGKRGYRQVFVQSLLAMPLVTILLVYICAKLIVAEMISEEAVEICVYAIAGITSICVSLNSAIRMPQKKAFWGIATAGAYAVMLLLGNVLFFGVAYGEVIPLMAVVILTGTAGSLLGAVKRRKYA